MHIRDWIATCHTRLSALSLTDFMKLLHKEFLPEGWEDDYHTQIHNAHLKSSDAFSNWLNNVCHINFVLQGSDRHFSDDVLCIQLESLLVLDLRTGAKNHNIKDLIEAAVDDENMKTPKARFMHWKNKLRKLTDKCAQDTKRYLEAVEELQHPQKRQAVSQHSRTYNTVSSSKPNATSSLSSSTAPCNRTPVLTPNKLSLLNKHQGCTKCRWGYIEHCTNNCPNDFPDPRTYKELMDSILLGHKCAQNSNTIPKPIGAITSASHLYQLYSYMTCW
jgi:hypothetical protein